jgi:prepilin-type N-terminal cleavage/methylation domain-containing protein
MQRLFSTNMHRVHNNHGTRAGFTLVEVMIALFVLAVGTISMINILSQVIGTTKDTQDRVVAANLAQEGIELVRAIRADNWINGQPYDTGLGDGSGCVDYDDPVVVYGCGDDALYQDPTSGIYSHTDDGVDDIRTKFGRTITITGSADEDGAPFLLVTATASWPGQTLIVEDHLYDWL